MNASKDPLARIQRQVRQLVWMAGVLLALVLAVCWQTCAIGSRLP
jgi:4-hydroxybenzoate polyprenyltransferase